MEILNTDITLSRIGNDNRCTDLIKLYCSIVMGGQYFVYHTSNFNAGTEVKTGETWQIRYDKEFLPNKKFYMIGSGNDGDYCDDLLIDVDEIYDFFEERGVEKKKIIFLTSNNDLNHGLKTLTETIKTKGARKIDPEKWDNLITDIKTEKIETTHKGVIEIKSFKKTHKTIFSKEGNKIFFYFLIFYIILIFFLKKKIKR